MRFCILGSGSSGNSALIVTEGSRVLVDAGFSARRLGALLTAAGESIERIDAVFVTHEHTDHSSGIEPEEVSSSEVLRKLRDRACRPEGTDVEPPLEDLHNRIIVSSPRP